MQGAQAPARVPRGPPALFLLESSVIGTARMRATLSGESESRPKAIDRVPTSNRTVDRSGHYSRASRASASNTAVSLSKMPASSGSRRSGRPNRWRSQSVYETAKNSSGFLSA